MTYNENIIHIIQNYLYNENYKIKKGGLSKKNFKHFREQYEEFSTPETLFDFLVSQKLFDLIPIPSKFQYFTKCKECGKELKFSTFSRGYHKTCSHSCSTKYNQDKIKDTLLKRYGDENYRNGKTISKKQKENYNNIFIKENIIKMRKETNLERYGDENFTNKEKMKATNMELYGVEYIIEKDRNLLQNKRMSTMLSEQDDGLNVFQRTAKNRANDIVNGKNSFVRASQKAKETNYKSGLWCRPEDMDQYRAYSQAVWVYTRRNDLTQLHNHEKRDKQIKGDIIWTIFIQSLEDFETTYQHI